MKILFLLTILLSLSAEAQIFNKLSGNLINKTSYKNEELKVRIAWGTFARKDDSWCKDLTYQHADSRVTAEGTFSFPKIGSNEMTPCDRIWDVYVITPDGKEIYSIDSDHLTPAESHQHLKDNIKAALKALHFAKAPNLKIEILNKDNQLIEEGMLLEKHRPVIDIYCLYGEDYLYSGCTPYGDGGRIHLTSNPAFINGKLLAWTSSNPTKFSITNGFYVPSAPFQWVSIDNEFPFISDEPEVSIKVRAEEL